jgi:hypothetical protein
MAGSAAPEAGTITVHSFVYENAQAASGACARKILDLLAHALATQPRVASAVSGEPVIDDRKNPLAAAYVEKFHPWRVTLLRSVLFRAVLREPYNPQKHAVRLTLGSR